MNTNNAHFTHELDATLDAFFEGPEKKLEVDLRHVHGNEAGLRAIPDAAWAVLLDTVHCTILSKTSSSACDAFVLSESSLFVYPYKMVLKTCGTTTLLRCLEVLLSYISQYVPGSQIDFLLFSRKNLGRPCAQKHPHGSFADECAYLESVFGTEVGRPYVMGPLNRDHWYLYLIDFTEDRSFSQHPDVPVDQTLEVMMHDLDQGKMSQFTQDYFEKNGFDKKAAAQVTGITDIQPGTKIDDFLFEPCGYSMNGLLDNSYSTIHITPEPTCSFVSYETNVHLCDYSGVVERVLETFLPGRVTVTLFKDRREDVEGRDILKRSIPGYTRTTCTQYEFSPKYDLLMLQYDRVQQYDMVQ